MTPFEQEMDDTLLELLEEFGFTAELAKPSGSFIDETTLEADPIYSFFETKAIFFDPTTSALSGFETVLTAEYVQSKKWAMVRSIDAAPETGDTISNTVHGSFVFDMITAVGPNNPIYYKVALQKVS